MESQIYGVYTLWMNAVDLLVIPVGLMSNIFFEITVTLSFTFNSLIQKILQKFSQPTIHSAAYLRGITRGLGYLQRSRPFSVRCTAAILIAPFFCPSSTMRTVRLVNQTSMTLRALLWLLWRQKLTTEQQKRC